MNEFIKIATIDELIKKASIKINKEIASVLKQLARVQENIWKGSAYTTAAQSIENLDYPITDLAGPEEYKKEIEGIGADIADEIYEYLTTHEVKKLEILKKKREEKGGRFPATELLSKTQDFFNEVQALRLKYKFVGSYRRGEDSVKDLDLIGLDTQMDKWTELGEKYGEFWSKGEEQLDFNVNGVQINIWVVPEEEIGSAILFYTGPRTFNVYLATQAKEKGLTFNRHGLFDKSGKRIALTEKEIFDKLNISWIKPEER